MKPKILKTEAEYQEALAYLDTLMDAEPGSPEEEELELFSTLVEQYEQAHFPIDLPDPVAAIEFRMDQQGLTRKDLKQFIGSQSKVSEVLNRKRPLSLAMIRALHTGLGIPAEVLLQEPGKKLVEPRYDYRRFPFRDMFHAGFFPSNLESLQEAKGMAEELLEDLFSVFCGQQPQPIFPRCSEGQSDEQALIAWQARVMMLAESQNLPAYDSSKISQDFIRDMVQLSYFDQGPLLAKEKLNKRGIPLIILRHLPHTYLDGACFQLPSGRAVIGLTLRHDRLDNFWFTLTHELAHILLHLDSQPLAFFDDTESSLRESCDPQEEEANSLARDMLIPRDYWEQGKDALLNANRAEIHAFAEDLQISPAILAGRIRWESNDYTRFDDLIGRNKVRQLFFG